MALAHWQRIKEDKGKAAPPQSIKIKKHYVHTSILRNLMSCLTNPGKLPYSVFTEMIKIENNCSFYRNLFEKVSDLL